MVGRSNVIALPRSARWLEECLGAEAALKLCDRLGGSRLHIPKDPSPSSRLVLAIGMIAARKLCAEYYGDTVILPSKQAIQAAQRRHDVRVAVNEEHMPVNEAAVHFGISIRHVRRLAK